MSYTALTGSQVEGKKKEQDFKHSIESAVTLEMSRRKLRGIWRRYYKGLVLGIDSWGQALVMKLIHQTLFDDDIRPFVLVSSDHFDCVDESRCDYVPIKKLRHSVKHIKWF